MHELVLLYSLHNLSNEELGELIDLPYKDERVSLRARRRAQEFVGRVETLTDKDIGRLSSLAPPVRVRVTGEGKRRYELFVLDDPADPQYDPWAYVFLEHMTRVCGYEKCGRLFVPRKRSFPRYCSQRHAELGRLAYPDIRAAERQRLREYRREKYWREKSARESMSRKPSG